MAVFTPIWSQISMWQLHVIKEERNTYSQTINLINKVVKKIIIEKKKFETAYFTCYNDKVKDKDDKDVWSPFILFSSKFQ